MIKKLKIKIVSVHIRAMNIRREKTKHILSCDVSVSVMYHTDALAKSVKEYEEGWYNLEKVDFQVDYILTHFGPREVVADL